MTRLLLLVLFLTCNAAAAANESNRPAPDCKLFFRNQETVEHKLSQFRNKVVLIDFWASWCGPCMQSFPYLNSLHQEFADKGLQIIGVNLDEDSKEADAFLANHPAKFPIAVINNQQCAQEFLVEAMPSSYVIDRKGVIRLQKFGFRSGETDQTRQNIEKLLLE